GFVAREAGHEKPPIGIVFDDPFGTQQLQRLTYRHPAGPELLSEFVLAQPHARSESSARHHGPQFVRNLGRNAQRYFGFWIHHFQDIGGDRADWQSSRSVKILRVIPTLQNAPWGGD